MGATVNGMAVSKIRPFGATFLIFSDYMKPPIRLAALMEIPVIYMFTHDSIGLGEDGPTHQPIEQLARCGRCRAWSCCVPATPTKWSKRGRSSCSCKHEPALLMLTRQALPTFDRTKYAPAAGVAKGAYILADAPGGKPEVILMATGSEVSLCVDAYEKLKRKA